MVIVMCDAWITEGEEAERRMRGELFKRRDAINITVETPVSTYTLTQFYRREGKKIVLEERFDVDSTDASAHATFRGHFAHLFEKAEPLQEQVQ
jgi:hypothetical protein